MRTPPLSVSSLTRIRYTDHTKNSTRVAAGLKAAIHNPNVSNEARKHARERLEKMKAAEPELQSKEQGSHTQAGEGSPGSRVLAGYKATLTSTSRAPLLRLVV